MHEINELVTLRCRRMKGYPGHMYIPGESADGSDDRYVVLKSEKKKCIRMIYIVSTLSDFIFRFLKT